ncbi:uncharacterized protein LOC129740398 [Uranotaenia lowii]|uniref:uncharacterized protein LOC129740398 n=1 Tax=Uranotaenia lowii TaxID=190385 RepID=UPI002478752D|nr:uncharacterized protein LOC129740398 [Uranotaenia lowii]
MRKVNGKYLCVISLVIFSISGSAYTTQRSSLRDEEGSPFMDMASEFLQSLGNQNGGGGGNAAAGLSGIASMILPLMANAGGSGKSTGGQNDGVGAILSGIGSMLANANGGGGGGGGGGFDPAMIGNVIQMFAGANEEPKSRSNKRQKRQQADEGNPMLDTVLNLAQTWLANSNSVDRDDDQEPQHPGFNGETLANLLPLAVQAFQSFSGPEMEKTQEKHKSHSWVLPPFLEHIHVMWDQFTQSELAEAIWAKVGLDKVFKGFVGRDGKLDYDKLFDTLQNQSFRRRWIKSATIYLAEWANYIANPEVYQRYVATGQMMANGFLQSRGYPKQALLDMTRPSESISNLIDHTAKKHLQVKIASVTYVKPAVNYVKDLLKLGKAKQFLQQYNVTELTDKLTDTLNLEVIEPVLKVHRAYRQTIEFPHCDKYILCEINSHDPKEKLGLGGFKHGVIKFGSMAASWFISQETQTPFWTLFAIINDPHNCDIKHPADCADYHENESKVTTEYPHNEL